MTTIHLPSAATNITLTADDIMGTSVPEHNPVEVSMQNMANSINQESRDYYQGLFQQQGVDPYGNPVHPPSDGYPPSQEAPQDEGEEEGEDDGQEMSDNPSKRIRKKKKNSTQQRIDQLTREKEYLNKEKEQYKNAYTATLLENEQKAYDDKLNRLSSIMMQAQKIEDEKTYVDANIIMNDLVSKKNKVSEALNEIQQQYNQQDIEEQENFYREAEERLKKNSDDRDLRSEHYIDLLREFPILDPFDQENYDHDFATEFFQNERKHYNRQLKIQKKANHIATPGYYNEIGMMLRQKLSPTPYYPPQQSVPYQQPYGEDPMSQMHRVNMTAQDYQEGLKERNLNPDYLPPSTFMDTTNPFQAAPSYPQAPQQQPYPQAPYPQNAAPAYPAPQQQPYYPPQQQHAYPQQNPYPQAPQRTSAPVTPVNRGGYNTGGYAQQQMPALDEAQRKVMQAMYGHMKDERGQKRSNAEVERMYMQDLQRMQREQQNQQMQQNPYLNNNYIYRP